MVNYFNISILPGSVNLNKKFENNYMGRTMEGFRVKKFETTDLHHTTF